MNNLWDDVGNEEFRDIPDETQLDGSGQLMHAPPVSNPARAPQQKPVQPKMAAPVQPAEEELEEYDIPDLSDLSEEDDFSEVLNDANLRIEQGRLYQMIMNHDLFDGMEADVKAVKNVQKEIRKFARERMEIMLGMRQEKQMEAYAMYNAQLATQFNDLEIDILKKIASKATNGATETAEANEVAVAIKEAPKKQSLNKIGVYKSKQAVPAKPVSKLANKPEPLQRKRLDPTVEQILAEEGVSRELIEEDYRPMGKPFEQLSEQEKTKRARETAARIARRKTVKSPDALPMATEDQQAMLAAQRASQISQGPGMAVLLDKIRSMPAKN